MAQYISSRADIVPDAFSDELSALQDAVPPSSLAEVHIPRLLCVFLFSTCVPSGDLFLCCARVRVCVCRAPSPPSSLAEVNSLYYTKRAAVCVL